MLASERNFFGPVAVIGAGGSRILYHGKTIHGAQVATARAAYGRLGLAQEAQDRYALIVVDAFNSDAVPVHLLTREAIGLYLARLAPGGMLLFNATNDYLDLEGVLGRAADDAGLSALVRCDEEPVSATAEIPFRLPSDWVALARTDADLAGLSGTPGWRAPRSRLNFGRSTF